MNRQTQIKIRRRKNLAKARMIRARKSLLTKSVSDGLTHLILLDGLAWSVFKVHQHLCCLNLGCCLTGRFSGLVYAVINFQLSSIFAKRYLSRMRQGRNLNLAKAHQKIL